MTKAIPGSFKNKVVASDLQEERDKCAFNQTEFTTIIYGGKTLFKVRKQLEKLFEDHPKIASQSEF